MKVLVIGAGAATGRQIVLNTIGTQTPWAHTGLEPVAGRTRNRWSANLRAPKIGWETQRRR
jgi:hypothetical protein